MPALAQDHRIGVSLGSASGKYETSSQEIDLSGEVLELPLYSYTARSGLVIGFRLMEFAVRATEKTGPTTFYLSY